MYQSKSCRDASPRYVRYVALTVASATHQMLVVALVHSRLDYGKRRVATVLVGLPAYKSTPVDPERVGSTDLPPEHPRPQ